MNGQEIPVDDALTPFLNTLPGLPIQRSASQVERGTGCEDAPPQSGSQLSQTIDNEDKVNSLSSLCTESSSSGKNSFLHSATPCTASPNPVLVNSNTLMIPDIVQQTPDNDVTLLFPSQKALTCNYTSSVQGKVMQQTLSTPFSISHRANSHTSDSNS